MVLARGERLDQVVVGAGLQSRDRGLVASAGGEQDDRDVAEGGIVAHRLEELEAIEPRHHHVAHHQGRPGPVRDLERGAAILRELHLVVGREDGGDIAAHVRVVIDDQDARRGARRRHRPRRGGQAAGRILAPAQHRLGEGRGGGRRGRRGARGDDAVGGKMALPAGSETVKVVPCWSALSTLIDPPWSRDQILDQRQADAGAFVRARARTGTRWKRAKSRGISSAGMPVPVSRTSARHDRPASAGRCRCCRRR